MKIVILLMLLMLTFKSKIVGQETVLITYSYDTKERLEKVTTALLDTILFEYDEVDNMVSIISKPFCSNLVENTQDDGYGTLRRAIVCACPGDTIEFSQAITDQTIHLSSEIVLDKDLVFKQDAASLITIAAEHPGFVFSIISGIDVHIENIHFYTGMGNTALGILNEGNVLLKDVYIFTSGGRAVENKDMMTIEGNCNFKIDD